MGSDGSNYKRQILRRPMRRSVKARLSPVWSFQSFIEQMLKAQLRPPLTEGSSPLARRLAQGRRLKGFFTRRLPKSTRRIHDGTPTYFCLRSSYFWFQ
ncbi:hypothetical protein SAY86_013943 [Trapa natans]|uniref:Uncharacterized protein n=1 Tax=Trapa natans TaxID=22666 RepID=A0AAN7KMH9_TRANT|nr:hypothetical protein SAY86_013943 [Trapa natans]